MDTRLSGGAGRRNGKLSFRVKVCFSRETRYNCMEELPMKKWLCCWLACLLALGLTACGGASDASGAAPTESPDLLDVARGFRARTVEDEQADDESPERSDETPVLTDQGADDWETVGLPEMPEASETAEAAGNVAPDAPESATAPDASEAAPPGVSEGGSYTTAEDVALYLRLYGRLPGNFITKAEARKLGWSGGSLEPYAPGKCIGGDRFGNYEGLLPAGRSYKECDIDTLGAKSRGAKRLVFSDDGLIYYTEDHYNTFALLYGEE